MTILIQSPSLLMQREKEEYGGDRNREANLVGKKSWPEVARSREGDGSQALMLRPFFFSVWL